MLLLLSGDVELNPGPMIDDRPDIVLLLQWVEPLVDWQSFGLLLPGITQWTIKAIKQLDAKHQKLALCTKWLNTNPTATWRDVFNALTKRKELRCTGGIQMEETEKLKAKIVERDIEIAKLMKKKLQVSEELQSVKHQNSYSMVSDLLKENEKLKAKVADSEAYIATLTEEKTLTDEENEKLKAKVADSEAYIDTLTEEKTLTDEENKKLKVQVSELMDKESQLNKKLQSMEEEMTDNAEKKLQLEKELQSMKNTTTAEDIKQLVKEVGIQFDGILSLIPKEIAEIKAILIGVLQQKQLQINKSIRCDCKQTEEATSMNCLALIYKKCFPDKVIISLIAIQDMHCLKKLIKKRDMQTLLGDQISSFLFQFSDDKFEVQFPTHTIDGWSIKPLNIRIISKSNVVDYNSKSAEPPYIQLLIQPDDDGSDDRLSYALPIDGIQTSSDASTVQWNIEVSKNDLLPTTPSSIVVPSVVAATSTERVRAEVIAPVAPAVAYRVMSECISAFKDCGIGPRFLAEKLLEKKIINKRQKETATDELSRCTTDERMDQLLDIIKVSVQQEGKVFEYILEILKKEDTIRANNLYADMINKYKQYNK